MDKQYLLEYLRERAQKYSDSGDYFMDPPWKIGLALGEDPSDVADSLFQLANEGYIDINGPHQPPVTEEIDGEPVIPFVGKVTVNDVHTYYPLSDETRRKRQEIQGKRFTSEQNVI